ncbi:MAG: hypothetical protein GF398_16800, partial [Chitinivibrionales bacterium]|nr:hypothetical protein [Chitinivibrionales bacterium]
MFTLRLTAPAVLFLSAVQLFAASFKAQTTSGEAMAWQEKVGHWFPVKDSVDLGLSDSVFVDEGNEMSVALGSTGMILIKGPTRLVLSGSDNGPVIKLIQGQAFLKRKQPYSLQSVGIKAKECLFTPVGTAAAVKFTRVGEPTVATIKGSMKMQAPGGKEIVVGPRQYGTYNASSGEFQQGGLSENAISSLEQWGGVTADEAEPAAESEPQADEADEADQTASDASADAASLQLQAAAPAQTPPPEKTTESQPEPQAEKAETGPEQVEQISQPEEKTSQPSPSAATQAAPAQETKDEPQPEQVEEPEQNTEKKSKPSAPGKPQWEISAANVTVEDAQWTRIAVGVDVPIWKFGVFFDVEVFIDDKGNFSDKGWRFDEDNWLESLARKIRYVRFGYEDDPLFVKLGGLSSVTLGYGFVFDRFTNMLHYPDEKLLGLQLYLNDLTPIGLTLQTVIADFKDFRNDGGVIGARLGVKPLKMTDIPIFDNMLVSATYGVDLNQYAPAREWDFSLEGSKYDRDQDDITDSSYVVDLYQKAGDTLSAQARQNLIQQNEFDTLIEHRDRWASREDDRYQIIGGDIGFPIISTKLIGLDIYGQAATRLDSISGWGIGAPGAKLTVWKLWAQAEYRHVSGVFEIGHFGPYYLDERLVRRPSIMTKEDMLTDQDLNGIFGLLGMNIANVLIVDGSYQYMASDEDDGISDARTIEDSVYTARRKKAIDQRFEASAGIGDVILGKVPKLNKVEAYVYKTNIGRHIMIGRGGQPKTTSDGYWKYDKFFDKTPHLYYG